MGIPILILGNSGSGKSSSLRTFPKDELAIFNVASKPLPFRNEIKNIVDVQKSYAKVSDTQTDFICKKLCENKFKTYVIDDSQYLMSFELFNRVSENGYKKFTDIAISFVNMIKVAMNTSKDTLVFFLHHSEENERGFISAKTIGKMIDTQICLEGLFSIVLRSLIITKIDTVSYVFKTVNNGNDTVKTPIEMFEKSEIPNDLFFVATKIREYYNL